MRRNWGPWELDEKFLVLNLHPTTFGFSDPLYDVDLERCMDSAGMLDAIFQVDGHRFGPTVIPELLNALRDIMKPQANLCSSGISKRMTSAQVKRLVKQFA